MPFFCDKHNVEHPTLEERYEGDPGLLAFYQKKLPIRGWAGKMDCTEKEWVRRAKGRGRRLSGTTSAQIPENRAPAILRSDR